MRVVIIYAYYCKRILSDAIVSIKVGNLEEKPTEGLLPMKNPLSPLRKKRPRRKKKRKKRPR